MLWSVGAVKLTERNLDKISIKVSRLKAELTATRRQLQGQVSELEIQLRKIKIETGGD